MKAIQRLQEYLNVKHIKPTRFEKEIGLSNGYIGTQLKRNADLGEGVLIKIIDYCLDVNPEWLLTGRGSMLRDERPTVASEPAIIYKSDPKDTAIIEAKNEVIAAQEVTISALRDRIKELEGRLNDHSVGLLSAPAADTPSVGGTHTSPK
ncbi:hypothetical protein [Alistipes sp.]|uniref:hypothetical protein n=1 Tax=Alistipes sp. TaxID=1872444 RepID=UPI003AB8BE16